MILIPAPDTLQVHQSMKRRWRSDTAENNVKKSFIQKMNHYDNESALKAWRTVACTDMQSVCGRNMLVHGSSTCLRQESSSMKYL